MRKTLLLLTFISTAILSSAQPQFGVKAGMNINYIAQDGVPGGNFFNTIAHFGFHAGVWTRVSLVEKFFFSPELQYARKGMQSDNGPVLRFHYLEMPLMFGWAPVERFSIDAGPGLAYNLATFLGNSQTKADLEKIDFAINAGATVNVSDRISVAARYCHGVLPFDEVVFRDENNNPVAIAKLYNRTVLFSVKYKIF